MARQAASMFSRELALAAVKDSFPKLDPRLQLKNPVMFIVELGSAITTAIFLKDLAQGHTGQLWFVGVIAAWLWLTVLFANFAEAVAEGRGKAQADALRRTRTETKAKRLQAANSRSFELPAAISRYRKFVSGKQPTSDNSASNGANCCVAFFTSAQADSASDSKGRGGSTVTCTGGSCLPGID